MSKNRSSNRKFKDALANELRTVAEVLSEEKLVRDTGPLQSAAGTCTNPDRDGNQWSYDCRGLIFVVNDEHIESYRNTIPTKLQQIEIELSVRAGGRCWDRHSLDDPFDTLTVDCKIKASAQKETFVCSWHLDRNQGTTDEASRHFVHPCYHFQFGGRGLPENLGQFLFVEPPRLAHPPLDAILAVDFILTNYFPNIWRELRRDNTRYTRVVKQAQDRCWRPYATVTASQWSAVNPRWTAETIWPQLLPVGPVM